MGFSSVSFDPAQIAANSTAASSALARAAANSTAASSAIAKAAACKYGGVRSFCCSGYGE